MRDSVWNNVAISKGYDDMKTLLKDRYIVQERSIQWLAEFIGCTIATISNLLDWHDIEKRGRPKLEITISKKDFEKLSISELEFKYKLSRSKIWRMKKKLGLVTPLRS